MATREDWNVRHPVLAVFLMAAAVAVAPLVYGDWMRASLLAMGGGMIELVGGRLDRAAYNRGGIDELRRHRRRAARWVGVGVLALLAFLLWPLFSD